MHYAVAPITHNAPVSELKAQVTQLAQLMDEFGLAEARVSGGDWCVEFGRTAPGTAAPAQAASTAEPSAKRRAAPSKEAAQPETPAGSPISSPMTGIFYSSPSPTAPAFVKEGERVEKGQVVALIEAMKVFNEIVAPSAGTVTKIVAENGQLVQPSEPLLYIA